LLSDSVGRVLVHTGNLEGLAADAITSLLGGGIATLMETAEMIDDESIINLTLFEGKKTDLYAINIGVKLLLILIIDKGRNYSRLGTVWFYAKQTAIDLEHLLMEETVANPEEEPRFDSNIESQISDEIDRLMS
jgi:predicted regulator of Ras-like GTPase activity (Roadblock/LC7/MglB family)